MQWQSSKLFILTSSAVDDSHPRMVFHPPTPLTTTHIFTQPILSLVFNILTFRHGASKNISVGNLARKQVFQFTDWFNSTGATGYIGGDVLYAVSQAHPDWQVSVLVRNKDKAAKLSGEYSNARVVLGDLDSSAVIEEETKNADIVFRASITYLATIYPT